MKCPKCEHENDKRAKVCEKCDEPIAKQCVFCGCLNRIDADICGGCKTSMKDIPVKPYNTDIKKTQKTEEKTKIIVKTYTGDQAEATLAFQSDTARMAKQGYFPTSQSWAEGSYGCGAFLIALILCFIIIGIVVFIYMMIVKPDGILSVTYELRDLVEKEEPKVIDEKKCPQCAELVKSEAVLCRFCRYEFPK